MRATTKKRVSDSDDEEDAEFDDLYTPTGVPTKKRARTSKTERVNPEEGRDLVTRILANPGSPALTDNEDPMNSLLLVAKYARHLETMTVASAPAKPSEDQILAAANKLRKAAYSQIKKQMTVGRCFLAFRMILHAYACLEHSGNRPVRLARPSGHMMALRPAPVSVTVAPLRSRFQQFYPREFCIASSPRYRWVEAEEVHLG